MASEFFHTLKAVSKQRKLQRYVVNRQYLIETLPPTEYRLLDNTKSAIIHIDRDESVLYFFTMNKWSHGGKFYFGTVRDCLNWIIRYRRRKSKSA